ncbi:MAG: hypothetical protein FWH25_00430 [Syntrophorhabdaceae bacterium]|nr:hypothetical protein [Syntrophorhabdaceae bacterium]
MKRYVIAWIIFFLIVGVLPALAAEPVTTDSDGIHNVKLKVGEDFDVCLSGEVVCPASMSICDDLKVVNLVDLPTGLGFRGVGPGTTLCSTGSAVGPRRIFRITVR